MKKKQQERHPVYREMQDDIKPDGDRDTGDRAYGKFGRRIGIGSYMKFASLLGNSVSTGERI